MNTIDTDLPCMRCGYNLRTLALGGMCPECGEAVLATQAAYALGPLRYRALRLQGMTWMLSVRNAFYVGLGGWSATLLASVASNSRRTGPIEAGVSTVAFVMWCWFGWRLFGSGRRVGNAIGRASVAILVAGVIAHGMDEHWANYYFGKVGPLPWPLGDRFFAMTETAGRTLPYSLIVTLALAFSRVVQITWGARCFVILAAFGGLAGASMLFLGRPALPDGIRTLIRPMRQVLAFALIATGMGLPVWFGSVIWRLTRAIALGELPAASSRSSPSPRPPV